MGRVAGDDGDGVSVMGTKKGLVAELRTMHNNFEATRRLSKAHKMVILRYEDFYKDFGVIYAMLREKLDVTVPKKLRRFIANDCSFEANLKRSCKRVKGKEYQRTKINVAHCGIGTPGAWRTVVPKWGHEVMRKWCDPL